MVFIVSFMPNANSVVNGYTKNSRLSGLDTYLKTKGFGWGQNRNLTLVEKNPPKKTGCVRQVSFYKNHRAHFKFDL